MSIVHGNQHGENGGIAYGGVGARREDGCMKLWENETCFEPTSAYWWLTTAVGVVGGGIGFWFGDFDWFVGGLAPAVAMTLLCAEAPSEIRRDEAHPQGWRPPRDQSAWDDAWRRAWIGFGVTILLAIVGDWFSMRFN